MAIIALKAWYLEHYQPIAEVIQRPHDLRLNRNSLLKSALRADFLDEAVSVESAVWFQRYLQGEPIEFYIEGSGSYAVANVDLRSQEIYFTKIEATTWRHPTIYVSVQGVKIEAQQAIATALNQAITDLNRTSRVPLALKFSGWQQHHPWRMNQTQLRQIRHSLLHIVDLTPLGEQDGRLCCDPQVCLELGYSLQQKHSNQILLLAQRDTGDRRVMPFDLPEYRQLTFQNQAELTQTLPTFLESALQPYRLIS